MCTLLTNFVPRVDIELFPSGRSLHKTPERSIMERLLSDLQQHPLSWAFLQPVNAEEVPDYYEVIKEPMGTGSPIHLHILPWVCSRPWFRLQHYGTQTRDEPIPKFGRFRG